MVTVTGQGWVRNLIAGDYFGEMALVSGDPRTATVTAKTDVQLIKFSKHDFLTLIRGNPETLRYTNKKKRQQLKNRHFRIFAFLCYTFGEKKGHCRPTEAYAARPVLSIWDNYARYASCALYSLLHT